VTGGKKEYLFAQGEKKKRGRDSSVICVNEKKSSGRQEFKGGGGNFFRSAKKKKSPALFPNCKGNLAPEPGTQKKGEKQKPLRKKGGKGIGIFDLREGCQIDFRANQKGEEGRGKKRRSWTCTPIWTRGKEENHGHLDREGGGFGGNKAGREKKKGEKGTPTLIEKGMGPCLPPLGKRSRQKKSKASSKGKTKGGEGEVQLRLRRKKKKKRKKRRGRTHPRQRNKDIDLLERREKKGGETVCPTPSEKKGGKRRDLYQINRTT